MKSIIIYSTPQCPFSRALKEHLDAINAAYIDYNVAEEASRFEEMKELSGGVQTVPVVVLNKGQADQKVLIGFDQDAVDRSLQM